MDNAWWLHDNFELRERSYARSYLVMSSLLHNNIVELRQLYGRMPWTKQKRYLQMKTRGLRCWIFEMKMKIQCMLSSCKTIRET